MSCSLTLSPNWTALFAETVEKDSLGEATALSRGGQPANATPLAGLVYLLPSNHLQKLRQVIAPEFPLVAAFGFEIFVLHAGRR